MMGSGRASHLALLSAGVAEARTRAFGFEVVAAVRQAVECDSSEPFAATHLGPLLKGQWASRGDHTSPKFLDSIGI